MLFQWAYYASHTWFDVITFNEQHEYAWGTLSEAMKSSVAAWYAEANVDYLSVKRIISRHLLCKYDFHLRRFNIEISS